MMTSSSIEINNLLDNATIAARALLKEVGVEKFTSPDFHSGKLQHIVLFRLQKKCHRSRTPRSNKAVFRISKNLKKTRRPIRYCLY